MKLFVLNLLGMAFLFATVAYDGMKPWWALFFGLNAISVLSEAYDFYQDAKAHRATVAAQLEAQRLAQSLKPFSRPFDEIWQELERRGIPKTPYTEVVRQKPQ